jgi:sugar/nucleoside kinase (ribokinase family)
MTPDLVLLGNLIVDDVVLEDGTTRMGEPGGAILYAALGAALWGAQVGVCAPRGTDYPQPMLDALAARGVDLAGLRPLGRPGLRTWLLYEPGARRVVHRLGSPTHAEASPAPRDVPTAWRSARAFHVAPIPLDCQRPLIAALGAATGAWLSVDPHDPITESSLTAWREVLGRVDMLFVSDEELRLPDADSAARLRRLAGGRLALVALKRGARGGLLYDARSDRVVEWTARTGAHADPTGAGDAFAAGFLTALLGRGVRPGVAPPEADLRGALDRGVATASFALEGWGAAGLIAATPEAARERLGAWSRVREVA